MVSAAGPGDDHSRGQGRPVRAKQAHATKHDEQDVTANDPYHHHRGCECRDRAGYQLSDGTHALHPLLGWGELGGDPALA